MGTQSCAKCGRWMNNMHWVTCEGCGQLNPDIRTHPVVAAPPASAPIVLHDTEVKDDEVLRVVSLFEGSLVTGRAIALVPQGSGWALLFRTSGKSEVEKLQKRVNEASSNIGRLEIELSSSRQKAAELEKELLKAKDTFETEKELNETLTERLQQQAIKMRKLEGDLGKVQNALGTKGLNEILGSST